MFSLLSCFNCQSLNCRYLVTTFKVVPRGTEGAVSVEGTLAGLLASILLASVGCLMGNVCHFHRILLRLAFSVNLLYAKFVT